MEAVGIIPARGGSRRVPRKNMQDLGGKPLICWTIDAALESKLSRVVVSTEDVEIATVARQRGVDVVPQPIDSALDGTMSAPVVVSAIEYLWATEEYLPDVVCLLHPTSPFRTAKHIDQALSLMELQGCGSVISITDDTLNGAIYMANRDDFLTCRSFFVAPVYPYVMSCGIDIDTWDDLHEAREAVL